VSGLAIRLNVLPGVMVPGELNQHVVGAFGDRAIRVAIEAAEALATVADYQPWRPVNPPIIRKDGEQ
jgi:hypothetical protein